MFHDLFIVYFVCFVISSVRKLVFREHMVQVVGAASGEILAAPSIRYEVTNLTLPIFSSPITLYAINLHNR